MTREKRPVTRTVAGFSIALSFALGTTSCAPEPGDVAGHTDKESETTSPETEWGGLDAVDDDLVTELPASFPSDAFKVPESATIYNTGERNDSEWYLVLSAADEAAASALWDEIVQTNSFEVTDQVDTSEGGVSATLNSATITAQALTIPQTDGSVQMSFDLTRVG